MNWRIERASGLTHVHAAGYYEKLGFRVRGPEYDDAGIPHHEMELTL